VPVAALPFLRRIGQPIGPVAAIVAFAVFPIVLLASLAQSLTGPPPRGWAHAIDFHMFWLAARAFVDGRSPYPPPHHFVLSGPDQSFFYPTSTAALLTPLAPLHYAAASALFVAVLAVAVVVSLLLLDVRDWRCYGAVFASPAAYTAVSIGTLTPLLLLGAAATWRWRNRSVLVGAIVGLTVVAKLILWPLLIWLWFTRRQRSAVIAVATGAIAWVGSWLWLGFADFDRYPGLVRHAEISEGPNGYGLLWKLGGGSTAYLVAAAVAAIAVAAVASRRPEAQGFAIAVLAALVATPQLWLHYFALLVVAFGLFRKRFSPVWLVPLILWVTPHQQADGSLWRVSLVSLLVVATAAWALARGGLGDAPREDDEPLQGGVRGMTGGQHKLLKADVA
jgi:hypothetical protein